MVARSPRPLTSTLACLALLATQSCDAPSPAHEVIEPGTIGLTLSLPGVVVEFVRFEVAGNGISRAGDIAIASGGATASVLVGGIPSGSGYRVALSAATADGLTTCSGTATTDVIPDATTAVSVALQCRTTSMLGAVMGSGHFTFCPDVTSLSAAPGAAPAMSSAAYEETLDLAATAVDKDGPALTFAWTAQVGHFDDLAAASTVYRCAAPGPVTVTMTVSDGSCQQTVIATLVCLPFCTSKADGVACNDEDACTRTDICQGGVCRGGNAVVCNAIDNCHTPGVCDPRNGSCSAPRAANGTPCDDGNACTRLDSCQEGRCAGGLPLICAAADQCHVVGVCDPASGVCPTFAAPDFASCVAPGAQTAACMGGSCGVTSCRAGVGDCNHVGTDGCEAPLTSGANCGSCGHACAPGTSCVTRLCLSPPPTALAAVAGGWKTTLTWTPSPGATSYTVFRGASASGPFQNVGTTTQSSLIDLAPSAATSFYVVQASNREGASSNSAVVSATALPKQICITDTVAHSVVVFDASQAGAASPVRTVVGPDGTLRWPTDVTASLSSDELFVVRRGGQIDVYPLATAGAEVATRSFLTAVPGGFSFTLGIDDVTGELYTVDYTPGRPGGRVMAMNPQTGAPTRLIAGDNPHLGHPSGLVIDHSHGEILIGITGDPDPAADFPRIQAFDIAAVGGGGGDIAPKRLLGAAGARAVGGWAIAHDRAHDQIFTSCDCDNRITVFDRTATGNAAPRRTLELPAPYISAYALLMDEAADTIWVLARTGGAGFGLLEIPRGANGSVAPLRLPMTISAAGRLAPCN